MRARFGRFVVVGWVGFGVQTLAFYVLTSAGMPALAANILTSACLGIANFFVADRWTFRPMVLAVALLLCGVPDATASSG